MTGNFLTGSSYYAVVAPVDFIGITVTMTSNGIVYTKNSGVQITGSRNHTFDIGEINFPAQAACTISHYNDASGNLAGSNAVVSLSGVADNITAWSAELYKGETKVRSVSVTGGLSSGKIKQRVEVTWKYEADSKGMPAIDKEAQIMEAVEERLRKAMEKDKLGILTGIYTGQGKRDWVFIIRNLNAFGERLNDALAGLPQLPIEIYAEDDPENEEYKSLLELKGEDD